MTVIPRHYKFLAQDRDRNGNLRTYLRRPGQPKIRLRAEPGTAEFDREYRAAIEGRSKRPARPAARKPLPGSLWELAVAYFGSVDFRRLAARTRHVRRLILDPLLDELGHLPAAEMLPADVRKLRNRKPDKPEAANGIVKALRVVFKWGLENDLVADNPAAKVSLYPPTGEGFTAWSPEDVARFRAFHPVGTMARLAMELALRTTQRRSDVVRLGPQLLGTDGRLHFVQHKGRDRKPSEIHMAIEPELQAIIDATLGRGAETWLVGARGQPFTVEAFGNRFRAWCHEAGLPDRSAHGLRKAGASRFLEAGATDHETMAIGGWRTTKELQRYGRKANRSVLADNAQAKVSHRNMTQRMWGETSPQDLDNVDSETAVVPRGGIEPPTLRFSVACSTN